MSKGQAEFIPDAVFNGYGVAHTATEEVISKSVHIIEQERQRVHKNHLIVVSRTALRSCPRCHSKGLRVCHQSQSNRDDNGKGHSPESHTHTHNTTPAHIFVKPHLVLSTCF